MRTVTTRPGVYRMYNEQGDIIYVGKASNLKNRLGSYFQKTLDNRKTQALVSQIVTVQTTVTDSAADALLLEHNLIKEHRPRYNVVLRDDKSYPYIFISTRDDYPRLSYQRGARKVPGKYIGPYPSAGSVKRSLGLVQKLFRVRQCEDSYFRNRSRPCLQYQIKRCTAPCVSRISPEEYRQDVDMTVRVLEGKSMDVVNDLVQRMEAASEALDFESAARLRDQIGSLKAVSDLSTTLRDGSNTDYVAAVTQGGQSCVQVFFVRNGINLGNKAFYPASPAGSTSGEILNAFMAQFYLEHDLPREIVCSEQVEDADLFAEVFSKRLGSSVGVVHSVRGERAKLQALALTNAEVGLATRLASRSGMAARLEAVRALVELDEAPSRMECFDISHTMGEATVASCVVFNAEGALKSDYRRFNIEDITPGDDYAAMRQALTRRYTRMIKEGRELPDILFIDGGKGQIGVAIEVLAELQVDSVQVVGVSKGPDRRPGDETLILCRDEQHGGRTERQLTTDSPALLLIQQIRDEAHRFAIAGHRARRAKKRQRSILEDIKGLGPKRRKQLLTHFGGLQRLQKAGIEDISAVPGISVDLAARVYDELHPTRVSKG
ncbi:excinuclease ABC subunit UvrC [Granulosicoccus antarcticus]|uniref:UvrABC system protein C n=1 Tax=Granulosicoccus antarcticus IMCC3135 TaxID=1192854 RepID=A0A2Z2P1S8_9GAMM|nr:excinuclease ABC subunit UvrC [Granulosicoccus antarcticus]ASJ74437.1 UvrABC system protein C [Granulosicoccus antarcticus IMCC3135]